MWITIIITIYLLVLGIADLKKRRVPIVLLVLGGILLTATGICGCVQGELRWTELAFGMLPGLLMLSVAFVSHNAGYADGIVLLQLGFGIGYSRLLFVFCLSMLLLSMVSLILLLLRKVEKKTKMPYLTFLAFVFWAGSIWGG